MVAHFPSSPRCPADLRKMNSSPSRQVTTVITATEPIRFVIFSTDKVWVTTYEQYHPLKPKDTLCGCQVLAIVTIVPERYRTQYALLYTLAYKKLTDKECTSEYTLHNPAVSMSTKR